MQEEAIKKLFERFQKQINDRLEVIIKQQRTMQQSIDRLDRDVGEDRKDISDVKIRQGKIDEQLENVRELFSQQTQKLKETVTDAITDQVDGVKDQVQEINDRIDMIGGE